MNEGDNVSSFLYVVEDMILEALKKWLHEYRVEVKNNAKNDVNHLEIDLLHKAIENLDKEFETLEKQSNSLHDLLEQGIYTTDVFMQRSNTIREKKKQTVMKK